MEYKSYKDIELRRNELKLELDNPEADLEAIKIEIRSLEEAIEKLNKQAEKREALIKAANEVSQPNIVEQFEERKEVTKPMET